MAHWPELALSGSVEFFRKEKFIRTLARRAVPEILRSDRIYLVFRGRPQTTM
jgi:hypothetical protein